MFPSRSGGSPVASLGSDGRAGGCRRWNGGRGTCRYALASRFLPFPGGCLCGALLDAGWMDGHNWNFVMGGNHRPVSTHSSVVVMEGGKEGRENAFGSETGNVKLSFAVPYLGKQMRHSLPWACGIISFKIQAYISYATCVPMCRVRPEKRVIQGIPPAVMKSVHPSIRSSYNHKLNPYFHIGCSSQHFVPVRVKHSVSNI